MPINFKVEIHVLFFFLEANNFPISPTNIGKPLKLIDKLKKKRKSYLTYNYTIIDFLTFN